MIQQPKAFDLLKQHDKLGDSKNQCKIDTHMDAKAIFF